MVGLPIVIAIMVGISVYLIGVLLAPKMLTSETTSFTRRQLKGLEKITADDVEREHNENLMRDRYQSTGPLAKIYYALPFGKASHPALIRGGIAASVDKLFAFCFVVFVSLMVILSMTKITNNWIVVFVMSVVLSYLICWYIINSSIKRRTKKFVEQFPDSLDIIVRSVKSGFPINAAVNMVSESMPAPASEEFKQVSTEVVHGSTLVDALSRLSDRMQTPDIRFFVVVLTLQQEVGGSLAEVLSNLSLLIRKRKMMFKKIRAITSEGRFTGWVLGALPLFVAAAIHYMSPEYLLPLFNTDMGHNILMAIVGTIALGMFIIRRMVDMEI
ncbi:MAG: type II secretion system F family protein [Rickettsiales bacterium]